MKITDALGGILYDLYEQAIYGPPPPPKQIAPRPMRLKSPKTLHQVCAFLASLGMGNRCYEHEKGEPIEAVEGLTIHAVSRGQRRAFYVELEPEWRPPPKKGSPRGKKAEED